MKNRLLNLLVHAGAPSGLVDDNRYRIQALSLTAFHGKRIDLDQSAANLSIDPTIYVEDSQAAFTALESQLFSDGFVDDQHGASDIEDDRVAHVTPSPSQTAASRVRANGSTSSSPLTILPCQDLPVANSDVNALQYVPSQNEHLTVGKGADAHFDGPTALTESSVPIQEPKITVSGDVDASRKAERQVLPSPNTNFLRKTTTEDPPSTHLDDRSIVGGRAVIAVDDTDTNEARSQHDISSHKGDDSETVVTTSSVQPTVESAKQASPTPVLSTVTDQITTGQDAELLKVFSTLAISIRAPPPDVGFDPVTTFLTKHLLFLETHTVAQAFTPVSTVREIRKFERGYWQFDAPRWPTERSIAFWQYLERAIQAGAAGWGVWCVRSKRPFSATSSETLMSPSLGRVQVFCWGEIHMHVYLLLYVASHSKIRRLGLQWCDADDQVIVHMPGPA